MCSGSKIVEQEDQTMRASKVLFRQKALLSGALAFVVGVPVWSQSLTWLGTLGGRFSRAWDVSTDGRVVVGDSVNASGQRRAFRWTAADGMVDLGTLGGPESWARNVSADGGVVVG
ncbi:MAG: hypothetical protein K6U77_10815, partial [Armatimonadetes bacterium]|nr:hypothetical protein [Armatimonadota bacterium]